MSETPLLNRLRLLASSLGCFLSRNNIGMLRDTNGTCVRYGCFSPGGSDLLGYTPIIITQEMVGKKIAVFTAVEVKTATGILRKEQDLFINAVIQAGGIAGVARNEEDLTALIRRGIDK